jgi:hypothetical protein
MMFSLQRPHTRLTAAFVHFLFSLSLFALFVGVLLFVWYPAPYFSASGGWQGLQLVAAVDLVLGPLCTLILFNPHKSARELRADIAVVVLLQLLALAYGVKAVYEQRPVAVVFLDSSFYTVPALAITSQGVPLTQLEQFGERFPVYVYASRPESGPEFERFVHAVEQLQIPPHEQVGLYRPLAENFSSVIGSSLSIAQIEAASPQMSSQLASLRARLGLDLDELHAIALTSRYRNIVLFFDADARLQGTASAPFKTGDL